MDSVPRLQAVVFDMDGTLIDSSWVVPAAFTATIAELGGPTLDRDEVIASYVIGTPAAIMERFLGRQIAPSEIDGYHARLRAEAERRGVHPYPGIVEALASKLIAAGALQISARAGDEGKLFGSVTAADIADAVAAQTGVPVDRRDVHLEEPIRSIGTHEVSVKLFHEVEPVITVEVVPEG